MRNRTTRALAGLVALLALIAGHRDASAALADAENHFLHGRYAEAEVEAKKLKGKDAGPAALVLGRIQLRTGRYKLAEATFRAAAKSLKGKPAQDALVGAAESLRAIGHLATARKELEAVLGKDSTHLRARAILGEVLLDQGETAMAKAQFDLFYDDFNDGKIDDKNAEQMMYVAIAAQHLGNFDEANDTFRTAIDLDANLVEANVRWGDLFMEKYSAGFAEQSFDEVLKIDPNHPDALVGMARVKLEQSYDVKAANELTAKALVQNPFHVGAFAVNAELLIDNTEYVAAKAQLAKIFAVNPNHLHARALEATMAFLEDDTAAFNATLKKIFAVNAKYAEAYHVAATFAVKEHRYTEAIKLEEEALKLRPDYHAAMAELASNHLRMGDEAKGRPLLDQAFKGDEYNVRAYNLLNLYENVVDKDYEFAVWPPAATKKPAKFRFRMPKNEREVLLARIGPVLERAFDDMVKRYGFTPKLPTTIELFADADHYSVRTVGLPNLGALGVCFGNVITALSPHERSINWGMVLWHELGHVFAIQLSNSRVPRWFTEGLSEYETVIARKEWRRENDRDLWIALKANRLPGVMDLNAAFTRSQDINGVVVAYHQSSVMVTWMAQKWGMPKMVEALKLYGQGKTTPQVIKQVTGLEPAAFDAAFRKDLAVRLRPFDGSYVIELAAYADLEARQTAVKKAPADAGAQAALALAYLYIDELDKARAAAQAALKLDPKRKEALWVMGDASLHDKRDPEARQWLEKLIAAGGDGYDARGKLGLIAHRAKNLGEAEKQLTLAKKMNPEASEPWELLYQLYNELGQPDKALPELEGYAWIEQMDAKAFELLVLRHFEKKNWQKVVTFGEIALYINPWHGKVLERMGRAYNELNQPDDAIRELNAATGLMGEDAPGEPARIHFELAKAWLKKKDKKRASEALLKAQRLDPKNVEFKQFKVK